MFITTKRRAAAWALALLALPAAAQAQCRDAAADGDDPTVAGLLRDAIPADQDTSVPIDTPVRLRYFVTTPEPPTVCVTRGTPSPPCIPGTSAVLGDEVVWHPEGGALDRGQRYYVTYNETASGSATLSFVTGSNPGPPRVAFAGLTKVDADNATDGCDPGASDITVHFDRASSGVATATVTPWPDIDIEYVIYQTRGPGVSGPRIRDRVRLQRSGSTLVTAAQRTFRLSAAESSAPSCFNVQALDPRGRPDGNSVEQCVNPAKGNYFAGCTAGPARSRASTLLLVAALMAAVTRGRRRR